MALSILIVFPRLLFTCILLVVICILPLSVGLFDGSTVKACHNTLRVGCPEFNSPFGHVVLSLLVTSFLQGWLHCRRIASDAGSV